jgi:uncharacterized Zn-finger protein
MKKSLFQPTTTESLELNGYGNLNNMSYIETHDLMKSEIEDDMTYQCIFENCGTLVRTKADLEEHYSRHINSRLYKCEYEGCEKVYRSKENMTLHYKNIHLKLKPYKCRFCDSTFSHRNGIKNY